MWWILLLKYVYYLCAGGYGGKGTWGGLLDMEDGLVVDPNDPNYVSDRVMKPFVLHMQNPFYPYISAR